MVAVVHLVRQHRAVLGQLARRHGLRVERPSLTGGRHARLKWEEKVSSEN